MGYLVPLLLALFCLTLPTRAFASDRYVPEEDPQPYVEEAGEPNPVPNNPPPPGTEDPARSGDSLTEPPEPAVPPEEE